MVEWVVPAILAAALLVTIERCAIMDMCDVDFARPRPTDRMR